MIYCSTKTNKSGIYFIVNPTNYRIYIGSSCSLWERFKEHRRDLVNGSHTNHRLMSDFNIGVDFEFIVVESFDLYDRDFILLLEQFYIDFYSPYYNLVRNVLNHIVEYNVKEWIIQYPDGREIRIRNLLEFCRQNDLCAQNLIKVADGKINKSQGFRCRRPKDKYYKYIKKETTAYESNKKKLSKPFLVIEPNGKKKTIIGLNQFCKDMGWNRDTVRHSIAKSKPFKGYLIIRL